MKELSHSSKIVWFAKVLIKNLLYKNTSQDKIKGELFVLSSNLFHYVDIRVHKATDGHYVCGFKNSIQQLHKKIKQTLNLLS